MHIHITVTVSISLHAQRRCAQRGLTPQDVHYVLPYGKRIHARGRKAIIVVLRKRDIPGPDRNTHARLEGTQVLLSTDGRTVITVYRNRKHLPHAA